MGFELADLDALISSLDDGCASLDIDTLVARTARYALERQAAVPGFAPGARYEVGQRVWYQGEIAYIVDVRRRGNPSQGVFDVVDLRQSDGTLCHAVAGVAGAPGVVLSPAVTEPAAAQAVEALQLEIREALDADARFARFLRSSPVSHVPPRPDSRSVEQAVGPLSAHESATASSHFESIKGFRQRMHRLSLSRAGGVLSSVETWRSFTGPILTLLGWETTPLSGGGFLLSPSPVSAFPVGGGASLPGSAGPASESRSPVVMVAVGWGATLGAASKGSDGGSPVFQLVGALAETGARWGLLTNGMRWRLYSAARNDPDIGSTASEYFEFDLGQVLEAGSEGSLRPAHIESFLRWWVLFRSKAFTAGASGRSLWAELYAERASYARRVVRRLREILLESLLPEIAGGFVAYRFHERGVRAESGEELQEIVRASLGLVYRLLFLLFAESRELLPMGHTEYRGQSLTALVQRSLSVEDEARSQSCLTHSTPAYEALLALFRNLEHGAPALGLASCGGGLFNPVDADQGFLERHRLSDRAVARMLAALGRIDGHPVYYGALTLRHLSAVGEGLLESSLWVVEASAGQVALLNAQGEAQALSSTPLPDYLGVPAIERALTQVLDVREERYRKAMDAVVRLRRQVPEGPGQAGVAAAEQEARDALLGIKILDPTMELGTFLISALDMLVDGIMACVARYHRDHPRLSWESDPIVCMLREARGALRVEMEAQGLAQNPEVPGDEVLLARWLSQSALYGVDLNSTAVVLSRALVSMRAFAPGSPLPSLSGRLIQGNSLRSVRLADVAAPEPAASRDLEDAAVTLAAVRQAEQGLLQWDLVFPEVFLHPSTELEDRNPLVTGFDVVISNPPADLETVQAGRWGENSFLEVARRLTCKPHGRIAFVMVPPMDSAGG